MNNQSRTIITVLGLVIVVLVTFIATREYTLSQARGTSAAMASAPNDEQEPAPKSKQSTGKEVDPYEREQVKNTIVKSAKDFQDCYLKYLASNPENKSPSVKIDWQIVAEGTVKSPGVVASDAEALNECLVNKVAELRFPPPPEGRPFYVAHRFSFKTEEQLEAEQKEREKMEKAMVPTAKK